MDDQYCLLAFKSICNFVNDLAEVFDKTKSIIFYKKIVNMTRIQNIDVMKKHIAVFEKFCRVNIDCIKEKDDSKLIEEKIAYSERVFIDMKRVLKNSDKDTKTVIYQHLLTISAILIPESGAKEILKNSVSSAGSAPVNPNNFMNDIINKVQNSNINTNNPMEAISGLMQSGVFTDIMSSMQNGLNSGQLNLGQLLGSMQGMLGNLQTSVGSQNGSVASQNESPISAPNTEDTKTPDLSGMMQMLNTMLPAMMSSFSAGNTPSNIESSDTPSDTPSNDSDNK